MSYEKIVALASEPAKIRFTYTTSAIFNSLDLRTHYRARMIKDSAGESQIDDTAISQDENDIVKELLEEGVYDLGAEMFKIAQGVSNSIFFDSTLETVLDVESSGFELVDNEAYNSNLLPAIDKKFLNCLRYFCLRGWYSIVGSLEDVKANDMMYQTNLSRLKNLTFQLRKPTMT